MLTGNRLFLAIILLLSSTIAIAEPILVFKPDQTYLLIGVDNVLLNGESYDVRFGNGNATIFADQQTATAASTALVDQVFSSTPFLSLTLSRKSAGDRMTWLGRSTTERGQWLRVAQFWGERLDTCQQNSPYWCDPKMNQSVIALSSTHGPIKIFDSNGLAGFLSRCGDCGSMESQWTKQSVVEPSSLALFLISLVGVFLTRKSRISGV